MALAVLVCGLLVVVTGLLLQAGKQQRQYRGQHQQMLQQIAAQAAADVHGRIQLADALLQSLSGPGAEAASDAALRARLGSTGVFSWMALASVQDGGFAETSQRQLQFSPTELRSAQAGQTVLLFLPDAAGQPLVYLARQPEVPGQKLLVAELSGTWLWAPLHQPQLPVSLIAVNAAGEQLAGGLDEPAGVTALFAQRIAMTSGDGPAGDLAWNAQGQAWVGAIFSLQSPGPAARQRFAIVAADHDRPWSVAFWSALRTQSTALVFVLALAAAAGQLLAARYVPIFRQLRRALVNLPQRRLQLAVPPGSCSEMQLLLEAFNSSAATLDAQRDMQRALDEIDALLLAGGDHESVIDQVLMQVRQATAANNVGLTLVDPAMTGHGRLFAVNARGGCPVNRVVLDEQMVDALRAARTGLTIVRCEEVRHSFVAPLQADGSEFFWVWPVLVKDELAAVLAIGYVDQPQHAARVAACGTQCARRLGMALSSTARAEKLYRQAHFDPLTQLPNRLLFRDRLEQELASIAQSPARGALLYIDLDHFKRVNDALGHAAGDQLLSIVAQRLRSCVKEGDTVARLGGDEFTVILRHVSDAAGAAAVADRIIQSMQMPVRVGGKDHHVRASIGVTLFPDDGTQLDELLRNADLAMYRAKDMGRSNAVFYNAKMTTRTGRVADSGLHRALKRREFSLYYQPQYRVADGALAGVEALVRWQKPRDGLVASADFIPAAEESGLIVDLGGWVLDTACAQLAQWREEGVNVPRLAVNVSVQQLRDPGLAAELRRLLERHRLAATSLEFEINEAALTDVDSQACIQELAALGVQLVLDDFGTGHTALNNLRRYPVGTVKIDRSFIDALAASPAAASLAGTIIVMAHAVDKKVVAEGVETIEQLDFLRERGCDLAQGYFLARPLTAAAMTDLLLGRRDEPAGGQSAIA